MDARGLPSGRLEDANVRRRFSWAILLFDACKMVQCSRRYGFTQHLLDIARVASVGIWPFPQSPWVLGMAPFGPSLLLA